MRAAIEEIRAGEAFQIVVSQRFETTTAASPLDVYRVLRSSNPSPYLYLLRFHDHDVVGSSPESHVTVTGRRARLHPVAGTRPRGATPEDDARLAAELLADPKERAEHVMLVDLGRNDLGRVCTPARSRWSNSGRWSGTPTSCTSCPRSWATWPRGKTRWTCWPPRSPRAP